MYMEIILLQPVPATEVAGRQNRSGKGREKRDGSAGNQEGEDIYETEITIEELINYLFDDLNLPDIDRKKLAELESIRSFKISATSARSIPPGLLKKICY